MALLFSAPVVDMMLAELQSQVRGTVIGAGDEGYEEARKMWNLAHEQYPAVIVKAQSAADVSAAVRFARRKGLAIAAQSAGHGISRAPDDAVLVITAGMKAVQVDTDRQTARVEAGAKWGDVLVKAQAVGLAPLLGSTPDVGVVGYTLGGGLGWLARKYGLAADSVVFFEVVTAD